MQLRSTTLRGARPTGARNTASRSNVLKQLPARMGVVRAAEEEAPAAAAEGAEEGADAAAAAAPAPEESFSFNLNEARRGNSYEPSDVAAALAYYQDGAGDLPYEAGFAVNRFGTEDAAFFDDIDDNEGYAASEYLSVGIEEAAPKMKSRQRDEDDAFEEALEEFDQERAASAAFEGVEVLDDGLLDDDDGPDAPWRWDDGANAVAAAAAAGAAAAAAAADDGADALLAQLAAVDFDALKDEDAEQRELAAMVVDALVDDLDLVGGAAAAAGDDLPAAAGLTAAEEAAVADALALDPAAAGAAPELPAAVAAAAAELEATAARAGASAAGPLAADDVDAYVAALRGIDAAAVGGSDAGLDGVRKEAAAAPSAAAAPLDASLAVPSLPAALAAADAPFAAAAAAGGADADAEGDALLASLRAELAELDAVGAGGEAAALGSAAMFTEDADLDAYDAIIDATAEYMAAAGSELTSELLPDGGAAADEADDAAINPFDDLDEALVARGPLVELDEDDDANFQERILELSRVTKVVKGGKIMGFRAVVVVGDGAGRVGVGCQSGREVATAVKRSLVDAKKNLVRVPLVGAGTTPHRSEAWFKSAGVVVVPASEGTGVIAGGAVRSVLELAGVQNVLAKRLGSRSILNNARVTVKALEQLRTLDEVARARDLPLQALLQ